MLRSRLALPTLALITAGALAFGCSSPAASSQRVGDRCVGGVSHTSIVSKLAFARQKEGVTSGFDVDGWVSDGNQTEQQDTLSCGQMDFENADGVQGIDNQLARLMPLLDTVTAADVNLIIKGAIENGQLLTTVTLDGVDTREIPLPSLRALTGIVSQDTVLFHDTVRANIAYGAPDRYTAAQIEAAARAANAHEFIQALPQGYDTILGERGTLLSGGQRQRLAIARALLTDPPILILDEATSALDTESERLVQEAIDRLLAGRTVFVIAHRLSTVVHATQILVLDQGRIVERGTHADLLARGGAYARLHAMQQPGAPRGS